MRRRPEGLGRRGKERQARPRILVVCEGRVTEPRYFEALQRAFRVSVVEVVIDSEGGTPKTLVERAVAKKRAADSAAKRQGDHFLRFEEVWCVFDVDEHPYLADARQQARDNGVKLAVSNPCFELWALLHFQEQSAYLTRQKAQSRLRKYLPTYDKALIFASLQPRHEVAVQRARELDRRCESAGCPGENPSTGVYLLTERIRAG